ncbi:sensor histidine kinase [Aquabacterium humicola]|uniref:sensor histidine kinase n=1 Tax=Aquabacterium humicola TaxID=3237377 RepID=UPI002542A4A4|nr:histidine kinase dimerization/phosphoacceptor domain -containing protein [Rubrivivax pictus]
MQLRRQFRALIAFAVVLGLTMLTVLGWSLLRTRTLLASHEASTSMALEVTGLLVLTQDYLLHAEPRALAQWQARMRRIEKAYAAAREADLPGVTRLAAVEQVQVLPELFEQLRSLADAPSDSPLLARRRELAIDRLLGAAQSLADNAYQREQEIEALQADSEHRLMALAVVVPALLLVLLAVAVALVMRRVLAPLARLRAAIDAAARGTRVAASDGAPRNEIGELAEHYDRLADALAERTAALDASEALLRRVIDNVPALIGYWDREQRNRLANADYRRWFGRSPEDMRGRHIADVLGPELYAQNKPYIEGALAGERQEFDRSIPGADGVLRHSHASYVPHVGADGRVDGFVVLVTDVSEHVRSRQALARALDEKETLLKEVYHRVKNNLQVVQSLLSLQSRSVADASARDALAEMAQRVRAMALVHEQLYQAPTLSSVPLPKYVQALVGQLAAAARRDGTVQVNTNVAEVDVRPDTAIPLGLLLTELVGNSLKHAFAAGMPGHVTVSVQPAADGVRIAVADDGRGLPIDGTAVHPPTLGRQLAASLARQLGGELRYQSSPGAGTTASVQVAQL